MHPPFKAAHYTRSRFVQPKGERYVGPCIRCTRLLDNTHTNLGCSVNVVWPVCYAYSATWTEWSWQSNMYLGIELRKPRYESYWITLPFLKPQPLASFLPAIDSGLMIALWNRAGNGRQSEIRRAPRGGLSRRFLRCSPPSYCSTWERLSCLLHRLHPSSP